MAAKIDRSPPTGAPWELSAADWNGLVDGVVAGDAAESAARAAADALIIASGAMPANVGIAPVVATGTSEVVTVADWMSRLGGLVFNVRAAPFLATGDGVTDDTAAIRAAIAACKAVGGGIIDFPAGRYAMQQPDAVKFSSPLGIDFGNVWLRGAGSGNTEIISYSDTWPAYVPGRVHAYLDLYGTVGDPIRNIKVSGIWFHETYTSGTTFGLLDNAPKAITGSYASAVELFDCEFSDFRVEQVWPNGSGCYEWNIHDNSFHDNDDPVAACPAAGLQNVYDSRIVGNAFNNVFMAIGVGVASDGVGTIISGNTILDAIWIGISLGEFGTPRFTCVNNFIRMKSPATGSVTLGSPTVGIRIGKELSPGSVVANNTIVVDCSTAGSYAGKGIWINGSSGVLVTNNYIVADYSGASGATGVALMCATESGVVDAVVTGNFVEIVGYNATPDPRYYAYQFIATEAGTCRLVVANNVARGVGDPASVGTVYAFSVHATGSGAWTNWSSLNNVTDGGYLQVPGLNPFATSDWWNVPVSASAAAPVPTATLSKRVVLDFPAVGAVPGEQTLTTTVMGARIGDGVVAAPGFGVPAGMFLTGWVSASDTVTLKWTQITGAPTNPDSGGDWYTITVHKMQLA